MSLSTLDWAIIIGSFVVSLIIGVVASRKAGKSSSDFFLSGRSMPWWLLGISMVATTFAADTPNLVAEIVRTNGVSGNWVWWAFLLTGMLTTFVYAKLWRRSGVMTDLEFYEIRYSGPVAKFLRGFRALYLGVVFNVLVMAAVCLAGIKLSAALLGLSPVETLLIVGVITVAYSALGGLRGVILTDFFQFGLAIAGSIWACFYVLGLPEIGGLAELVSHPNVVGKLSMLPDLNDPKMYVPLLLVPLAVQWWASWYPGAEPGGGGYIAQRMLAAKDENNALGATFLFNIAHYALRPWPWILIALASLVMYPELSDLREAFPELAENQIKNDLGYPIMLKLLPAGLLGLVVASLIAALMSTLSTHLNWGSSYLVHDFYVRFMKPDATQGEQVWAGRIATVGLMVLAALAALQFESALDNFNIILQIGAGTGLIFILRWLWWRINAYSELAGMLISFLVAIYFAKIHEAIGGAPLEGHVELLIGVAITTVGWVAVTFLTRPTDPAVLQSFVKQVAPPMMGWKQFESSALATAETSNLGGQILNAILGVAMTYATLFGVGYMLYGQMGAGGIRIAVAVACAAALWARVKK
ncbi:MAG: sodium:solute symporter family protein [Saprospiraceae bacterium]